MNCESIPITLNLRTTFRIAHGASDTRNNVLLRLGDGWGEAAPVAYHGESAAQVMDWIEQHRQQLSAISEPSQIVMVLSQLEGASQATKAAIDLALHDALGKQLGQPTRAILGLAGLRIPQTSFTIPIADPTSVEAQVQAAAQYPIFKIKLGGPQDLASIAAIRQVAPQARIRIDANGGWDRASAQRLIPALLEHDIELIEQPLPGADREGYALLKQQRYPVPIIADEPIKTAADVAAWADYVDGVNIKLMKAGGINAAYAAIQVARAHSLHVMLGCMIESSLGVAGALTLAGLADWIDLDGPLLINNDPTSGLMYTGATLQVPAGPGLGVVPMLASR